MYYIQFEMKWAYIIYSVLGNQDKHRWFCSCSRSLCTLCYSVANSFLSSGRRSSRSAPQYRVLFFLTLRSESVWQIFLLQATTCCDKRRFLGTYWLTVGYSLTELSSKNRFRGVWILINYWLFRFPLFLSGLRQGAFEQGLRIQVCRWLFLRGF